MDDANLALTLKLWDIANIAVGICVAHAMSFIYKCSNQKFANKLRSDKDALEFTQFISMAGFVIYIAIIWFCYKGYGILLIESNKQFDYVWHFATWVRIFIVSFFTLLGWLVLKSVLKSPQKD